MSARSSNIGLVTARTAVRIRIYSHPPPGTSSGKEGGGFSKAGRHPPIVRGRNRLFCKRRLLAHHRVQGTAAASSCICIGSERCVASADRRWILLVREDEVALSPREAPDKPIAKAPLSIDDSVVMAVWAHGRSVARWRDQVRKLAEP